jgi:hypothetical protein
MSDNEDKNNKSFFELNLLHKNKLNTDYTEIDFQKGEASPRMLFRKRRLDDIKVENPSSNQSANKIKASFDNYLDLVHETYFANDKPEEDAAEAGKFSNFKFTSLDLLINPLRNKFVFETWSPYEIGLFECCVCKFGKIFDLYGQVIKTKTKDEILGFYYYWKQSKYYKIWKSSRYKRKGTK